MVGLDFDSRRSFEVVSLLLETLDDGQKLLVVYRVVDLGPRELLRAVCNRVPFALLSEGQYARAGRTGRISL